MKLCSAKIILEKVNIVKNFHHYEIPLNLIFDWICFENKSRKIEFQAYK